MNKIELQPVHDNVLSFYRKAYVLEEGDGVFTLLSYNTKICRYDKKTGKITRLWGEYSRTTQRHITEFLRQKTGITYSKKEYEAVAERGQ